MFAVSDFADERKRTVVSRFHQKPATGIDKGPLDYSLQGRVNPFYTKDVQWHNRLSAGACDVEAIDIIIRGSLSENPRPPSRFTTSMDLPLHPSNVWRREGGVQNGNATKSLPGGSALMRAQLGFTRV